MINKSINTQNLFQKKQSHQIGIISHDRHISKTFRFQLSQQHPQYISAQTYRKNDIQNITLLNSSIIDFKTTNSRLIPHIKLNYIQSNIPQNFDNLKYQRTEYKLKYYIIQKEKYQQALNQCKKQNTLYKDQLFPPCVYSLWVKNGSMNVQWKRFQNCQLGIQYRLKITQGKINNPYIFLFNLLSKHTYFLKKIFQKQNRSQYGIYYMRLCIDGIWKFIYVDDFIPVINGQSAFMNVHGNGIWPHILMKGLAKVYSTYQALMNMQFLDSLYQLTGIPITQISAHNQNLLSIVKTNFNNYFLKEEFIQKTDKNQFVTNVYSLKNEDDYFYVARQIRQAKDCFSIRTIQLQKQTHGFFIHLQKDKKYFNKITYQYSWARIILLMKQNQGLRYIKGKYSNQKNIFVEVCLKPGIYFIIMQFIFIRMMEWKQRIMDTTLAFYGQSYAIIKRRNFQSSQTILNQMATDIAQRFGKWQQINKYLCVYRYFCRQLGLIIQNFNNENNKKSINLKKSYKKQVNIKYLKVVNKQLMNSNAFLQIKIQPRQSFSVIFRILQGKVEYFDNNGFNFD